MHYTILYRGPLTSCNYGCTYCPFAKRRETREQLAADEAALSRFIDWARSQGDRGHQLSVLFTPWGEALIRPWYQRALIDLTNLPHVRKAAIQTNLSCKLDWVKRCDRTKLGLWCSYHPDETPRAKFVAQCRFLTATGTRYSVGIVGVKEQIDEAYALRRELPETTYLWVNAVKRAEDYYADAEAAALAAIDPLFPVNNTRHPSLDRPCDAGESVFSVDGDGTMRRCHFIRTTIGNLYDPEWERSLRPTPCTNATCGCHIGYVHLPELRLGEVFGDGLLERIPATKIWPSDVGEAPAVTTSPRKSIVRLSLRQVSASG